MPVDKVVFQIANPRIIAVPHDSHPISLASSREVTLQGPCPRILNAYDITIVSPEILEQVFEM